MSENTPNIDELLNELKEFLSEDAPAQEPVEAEAESSGQMPALEEDPVPVETAPVRRRQRKEILCRGDSYFRR